MIRDSVLELVLVSTPIGYLGSGRGGGVELTMRSLIKGLLSLGHKIILIPGYKENICQSEYFTSLFDILLKL